MLETASSDSIYAWTPDSDATPFERLTVFPNVNFDQVSATAMRRGVLGALDRLQPDAVAIHSYSMPDAHACASWCRRHRRVAVLMNDSTAADAPRAAWREAVKRRIVAQYDSALVAGQPQKRYHASLGIPRERIEVGYDVVDNEYFAASAAEIRAKPASVAHLPGLADPAPFFFASSRFIERKDLPTLIHAYADYREVSADPWRLVLLGDGVLRPTVEQILAERGVRGVTLAGWQQIDTLPAYYALASAFVHTATVDQWGLVVNEAMAAGLPVLVSTGAGCHEDLVEDGGNGYTFAPGDRTRLAALLRTLSEDADLERFGQRSREIIARFPLERFGTSLLAAVEAGRTPASHHGRHLDADVLTWAMRTLGRSPRAFHAVES